uniref:Uncharacterized protein n=1 Tax=Rhizophora mucronata TaxID=61149 RepID=A0A2P2JMP9_RHIMU
MWFCPLNNGWQSRLESLVLDQSRPLQYPPKPYEISALMKTRNAVKTTALGLDHRTVHTIANIRIAV